MPKKDDNQGKPNRRANGHKEPNDLSNNWDNSAMFGMTAEEMLEETNGHDDDDDK